MLVGDIIRNIRDAITDQPPTLPIPTASFSVVTPSASTLTAGNYYLVVTQRNSWGETLGTPESSVQAVSSGQGIQVTSTLLAGAVTIRAYLTLAGGTSGTESQFVESAGSPFTIVSDPTNPGYPPTRNTAYNEDLDGDSFSAGTIFDWVNDLIV